MLNRCPPVRDLPTHVHYRACPLCEAICGLELRSEGGQLVAIRGDANDPFSAGHICPKGNAILDLEADPDRLRRPLIKRQGQWSEIEWDEAFAHAARRIHALQSQHGRDSIASYGGNPNVHHFGHIAYLPHWLRTLGSRNVFSASSVDQWPHQLVNAQMFGHQFLLPIPDVDRTDYFLMLGANPVASNGSLFTAPGITTRLKALVARGRLVVIDPRRTETAAIANEHCYIKPAGDVWFLLALLQAMVRAGPPNTSRYEGKLADLERAMQAITAVPIDDIEALCGIDAATVKRIAGEFIAAPRAVAYGRMGLSTQRHGTLCQWLLQLINLYSGNLDREGGALPNDPVMPITGPGTAPGRRDRWRSRVRGLPEFAGELPVSVLAEEMATPGAGQVRGFVCSAGNPVLSTPDGARLDGLLGGLDFMLSIDIYLNESSRHAELILPPASPLTQYHYDSVFNAFAVRQVARINVPMRERDPDERADWEIFNGLAAALAAERGEPFKPLPPPRELMAALIARGDSGLDADAIEAQPHGMDLGALRPSLLRRLQTDSGMIECAPALFIEALAALRAELSASTPQTSDSLRLIGRRHVRSNNSWMHNAQRLVKGKPRHHLWVHADDLRRRGLADGERASLRSRVGRIDVELQASDDLMPGVVCLPHGFGHGQTDTRLALANELQGANYNALSDPAEIDAPSGNAALNGVEVWLERL